MTEPVATPGAAPTRTPIHLWIVGGLALLWHLMGVFDYLATELRWEPYMGQFTEEQLGYFYGFPSWMVAAWAIAVWGGLLGSIALLLRRRWAAPVFGLAIVGLAASTVYNFVLSEGAAIMGTEGVVFTVVIWIITVGLFLYSRVQAARGVLS